MGCDIHLTVEVRQTDGSWKNVDEWDADGSNYSSSYFNSRNYDLFAILANVRNGSGFAGVKTGGFISMAPPRGVPPDASPQTLAWVGQWEGDGHSHSYHSVAEIMAYDWTRTAVKTGVVDLVEWARWRCHGRPTSWSGGVGGGDTRVLPETQVADAWRHIKGEEKPYVLTHHESRARGGLEKMQKILGPGSIYTTVNWTIPYYHAGAEFLGSVLPRLWRLGKFEDVRVVFFFDN